ncbi:MAG TPA: alpha/beta hydrolase [Candidatus Competibacteraceae bacterium]|nr:alpha/beta hydrolase [Candidatus Competibacteraceae bacterium]
MSNTILLIHGAFMTSLYWENFMDFYERKGFRCLAPSWPYKDKPIDELRRNPPVELARLGVAEIVNHYAAIIRTLPEPPFLIGHSMGGLVVQMLLDRGFGAGGVAICSAPPRGVPPIFYWSVIKSSRGLLAPRGWSRVLRLSFKEFQFASVHTLTESEQRAAYDRYVVPESRRSLWQVATAAFHRATYVNFMNSHRAPLLLVAADEDLITPAAMNRLNLKRYWHSTASTEFKEFKGRTHWITLQPGWEEVADFIILWLKRLPSARIEHLPPAGMEQLSISTPTGLLQANKSNPILE